MPYNIYFLPNIYFMPYNYKIVIRYLAQIPSRVLEFSFPTKDFSLGCHI